MFLFVCVRLCLYVPVYVFVYVYACMYVHVSTLVCVCASFLELASLRANQVSLVFH